MLSRRYLLKSGGSLLACLITNHKAYADTTTHVIRMDSDRDGAHVWFDPIGLFVQPGDKIRWIIKSNVHTVASYHPDNDNHTLRMPPAAQPWNSGYLVILGDNFEVTLTVPGVYDYYCEPHEQAGMVGRIVVGEISGSGTSPFDYFNNINPAPNWESVPLAAQKQFPSPQRILAEKIVRIKQNNQNDN